MSKSELHKKHERRAKKALDDKKDKTPSPKRSENMRKKLRNRE